MYNKIRVGFDDGTETSEDFYNKKTLLSGVIKKIVRDTMQLSD